jgi:glycosyltransferase involved in cell wall biosynthesis
MGISMDKVPLNSDPALSIIIPLYNEEECIHKLYNSLKEVCGHLQLKYEIIFIDDGSVDGTCAQLSAIHREDDKVKVIKFRKNYGQTAAMAAGFEHAQGKVIVSMDGDLQNDPEDIPRLLDKIGCGFDIVCGWRKKRRDRFWTRRLPSVAANWIMGWMTGVRIHDNGCSLKAYRASIVKNISLYGEMHRFIPAMATLVGAKITEIVVNHRPRRFGMSKYGIGRIWKVILDIITVKMITGFIARPALWFAMAGLPFLVLGMLTLLIAGGMYLGGFVEGWMVLSTAAFLLLFLGTNLLAMGVVGELIVKTGDYSSTMDLKPSITEL